MDALIADAILDYMLGRSQEDPVVFNKLADDLFELAERFVVDDDAAFDQCLKTLPIETIKIWNEIIDNLNT